MNNIFNKRIFWDIDNIDYIKNKLSVIFRVIRYGDIWDLKRLKLIYSKTDITYFLKKRWNEIDPGEKKLLYLLYKNA